MHLPGNGDAPLHYPTPLMIVDGDCGFCMKSAAFLQRHFAGNWDVVQSQKIDFASLGLTDIDVATASWWIESVDGHLRRYSGAKNFAALLINSGRVLKPLGMLMLLPPISWIASLVYSWIARNRGKMPGASEACEVPPSLL
ncbi:MAG: hypothetical protein RL410_1477 [Actinomycetota bacterium]|jgi:predicted DCC family thiol-disulfide oxidoreductase YuxK